ARSEIGQYRQVESFPIRLGVAGVVRRRERATLGTPEQGSATDFLDFRDRSPGTLDGIAEDAHARPRSGGLDGGVECIEFRDRIPPDLAAGAISPREGHILPYPIRWITHRNNRIRLCDGIGQRRETVGRPSESTAIERGPGS